MAHRGFRSQFGGYRKADDDDELPDPDGIRVANRYGLKLRIRADEQVRQIKRCVATNHAGDKSVAIDQPQVDDIRSLYHMLVGDDQARIVDDEACSAPDVGADLNNAP